MNINKSANGTELTMAIVGRLDTVTAPEFEAELKASIGGVESLILDLAELEYTSSAGLRIILMAQKTMNKQGKMIVKNVNESVMEVFDITGMADFMTFE
ncbi:MAG: STAS domain-containing protein [Clostridia bacterium]|nr:STAS domain-containing protein [Clostridia bacterium]